MIFIFLYLLETGHHQVFKLDLFYDLLHHPATYLPGSRVDLALFFLPTPELKVGPELRQVHEGEFSFKHQPPSFPQALIARSFGLVLKELSLRRCTLYNLSF